MTSDSREANHEYRVLVFAPVGRDAELTCEILRHASLTCVDCQSMAVLAAMVSAEPCGALLLTEEALEHPELSTLIANLDEQPPWSDIPVLLFAGGPGSDMSLGAIHAIETLRNVTLLERPVRVAAVLTAIRAALRSRSRQYEVRDLLVALHRARSEAENANRLKDEFLATLSHELRTPLNAILGWTSMLTRGQVEPARLPHVFEILDRSAQSQAQLIADVLDVSRIITGKLQLRPRMVDLSESVERAVDAVRPAAVAKHVAVRVSACSDATVHGDPDRLQQVFWNLVNNAIKFTPAGGLVRVTVAREGAEISVSVADSGIGIPREFVPFVFDRFRQADQTTTRTHGGLGLGLSIVKHITELHGGTVSASSSGPGTGARFEVRLPAADAASEAPHRTARESADLKGHAVLLVDDDAATREVVATALEHAHASVQVAASAAEARDHLMQQIPALIIADLGMPDEDGFSFIRDVRRSRARHVPAIALSAYADERSREAALAAGFTAFLAKPTRTSNLLELARTLLRELDQPATQ